MKERTLTAQARQPPQFLVRLFFAELMISKTRLRSTQRAQVRARLKKSKPHRLFIRYHTFRASELQQQLN